MQKNYGMKNAKTFQFVLLLLISACSNTLGIDYYIAVDGNDANPGTKARPFATLERGRDAVREWKQYKSLPAEGITIWIREGVYKRSRTFDLTSEDSGRKNSRVIFRACEGEKVHICGGEEIPASVFRPVRDQEVIARLVPEAKAKVLEADIRQLGITDYGEHRQYGHALSVVEAPLEFFVNDQVMPLARYPNKGGMLIGEVIDKGSIPRIRDYTERGGIFRYTDDRHERWVDSEDIWLQGTFCWGFADDKIKVLSIDPANREVRLASPHMYGLETGRPFRKYVALNILEEIDEPGEWYLDRKKGRLYFWPIDKINKLRMVVSMLAEPIIALDDVSFVTLQGLIVEIGRGIGIYIEEGQDNLIAGCTIRNVGTSGIFMGHGSKQTFPHITHDDYEGVPISRSIGNLQGHLYKDVTWDRKSGKNHTIQSCNIYQTGCGGVYLSGGRKRDLVNGNSSVVNCRIWDYNRRNKFLWAGINVDGCGNCVRNNEIFGSDFQGIYVHGNDHLFEYNHVHHVALDSDDTSAWYLGRDPSDRGNIIRYNFFHHVGRPDRMVMGIYFDESTCGVTVYGNIFYKMSTTHGVVFSNAGHDLRVENNLFLDCRGPAVQLGSLWYTWANTRADIDELFALYEQRLTKLIDIKSPPYAAIYPELRDWLDPIKEDANNTLGDAEPRFKGRTLIGMRPRRNVMVRNVIWKCPEVLKLEGQWAQFENRDNYVTTEELGFIDEDSMDFLLKDNSIVYKNLPEFEPIEFRKIGLIQDVYRKGLDIHRTN